jgi:hypothetical protein
MWNYLCCPAGSAVICLLSDPERRRTSENREWRWHVWPPGFHPDGLEGRAGSAAEAAAICEDVLGRWQDEADAAIAVWNESTSPKKGA